MAARKPETLKIIELVSRSGGATLDEVCAVTGLARPLASRRLDNLSRVYITEYRHCILGLKPGKGIPCSDTTIIGNPCKKFAVGTRRGKPFCRVHL